MAHHDTTKPLGEQRHQSLAELRRLRYIASQSLPVDPTELCLRLEVYQRELKSYMARQQRISGLHRSPSTETIPLPFEMNPYHSPTVSSRDSFEFEEVQQNPLRVSRYIGPAAPPVEVPPEVPKPNVGSYRNSLNLFAGQKAESAFAKRSMETVERLTKPSKAAKTKNSAKRFSVSLMKPFKTAPTDKPEQERHRSQRPKSIKVVDRAPSVSRPSTAPSAGPPPTGPLPALPLQSHPLSPSKSATSPTAPVMADKPRPQTSGNFKPETPVPDSPDSAVSAARTEPIMDGPRRQQSCAKYSYLPNTLDTFNVMSARRRSIVERNRGSRALTEEDRDALQSVLRLRRNTLASRKSCDVRTVDTTRTSMDPAATTGGTDPASEPMPPIRLGGNLSGEGRSARSSLSGLLSLKRGDSAFDRPFTPGKLSARETPSPPLRDRGETSPPPMVTSISVTTTPIGRGRQGGIRIVKDTDERGGQSGTATPSTLLRPETPLDHQQALMNKFPPFVSMSTNNLLEDTPAGLTIESMQLYRQMQQQLRRKTMAENSARRATVSNIDLSTTAISVHMIPPLPAANRRPMTASNKSSMPSSASKSVQDYAEEDDEKSVMQAKPKRKRDRCKGWIERRLKW